MDKHVRSLNTSKVFAGLMIVILNIASKYVTIDVSDSMECYLKSTFSRQLLLFSIIWFGTRDIYISLCGSILVIIAIDFVFNEKSKFCCLASSPLAAAANAAANAANAASKEGGGGGGGGEKGQEPPSKKLSS